VITTIGVILAAAFTYGGVRYTQRQSRAAARATADLDRTKVDAAAYESAKTTWERHVDDLQEQVTDLRAQVVELRAETERERRTARELRARVDELEHDGRVDRARIRELTDYARDLLRILGEHEISYPSPPGALSQ
jgi:hypothetical protein